MPGPAWLLCSPVTQLLGVTSANIAAVRVRSFSYNSNTAFTHVQIHPHTTLLLTLTDYKYAIAKVLVNETISKIAVLRSLY